MLFENETSIINKSEEESKEGPLKPLYIALASYTRHYGGPEEGGWWYNWCELKEVERMFSIESAMKVAKRMQEENPPPRYDIYSAANNGEAEHTIYIHNDIDWINELQSKEVPRYE